MASAAASMNDLDIQVSVVDDPKVGLTVGFNFSRKIKSFGLSDELAEAFALHILKNVKAIRAKKEKAR
jgi:hypothetical protein